MKARSSVPRAELRCGRMDKKFYIVPVVLVVVFLVVIAVWATTLALLAPRADAPVADTTLPKIVVYQNESQIPKHLLKKCPESQAILVNRDGRASCAHFDSVHLIQYLHLEKRAD